MKGNWDFYFCRVDEAIASIYLNLDMRSLAPDASKPVMAYLRVYLNNPRPDGLSSDADFDALVSLEDSVIGVLNEKLGAVFVGRKTSSGCRDFYFYTQSESGWDDVVASAMADMRFEFESGTRSDPEWGTYLQFLYPSDRDLQRMKNRETCDVFESDGDKLDSEREIDHWIYFDSDLAKSEFLNEAKALGFEVRQSGGPEGDQKSHWVQIFRTDLLSRDNIDSVCLELLDLVKNTGGDYDGWEAPVVK